MSEEELIKQIRDLENEIADYKEQLYLLRIKRVAKEYNLAFGETIIKIGNDIVLLADVNTHLLIRRTNITNSLWGWLINKKGGVSRKGKYIFDHSNIEIAGKLVNGEIQWLNIL